MKARMLVAAAVAAGGVLFYGGQARAFESWCFDDPVVQVGNEMVQTTVGVWGDPGWVSAHVHAATITYHLPANVKGAKVKATTTPYFAENVVFVSDKPASLPGQPIVVDVSVSFATDAQGAHALAQMVNTAQGKSKGPQNAPKQGLPFTLTTFGDATGGLSAAGIVPQSGTTTAAKAGGKH